LRWALFAEIDENEALASQNDFQYKVIIAACIISLIVTLASMALSASFIKPVSALLNGVQRLKRGQTDLAVTCNSRDEFGDLTQAFNGLVSQIHERDITIQSMSSGHQALLHSLFPPHVAENLEQGRTSFSDNFPQVTVIYLVIDGFTKTADTMTSDESVKLLNDVNIVLDKVALQTGIEKVKSIGEHYQAACGLSVPRLDHTGRCYSFAKLAVKAVQDFNREHKTNLALKIGAHPGSVQGGVIGEHRFSYDIWGTACFISRRFAFDADPNCLRISRETHVQIESPPEFSDQGKVNMPTVGDVDTVQASLLGILDTASDDTSSDNSKSDASDAPT
jgi:class 3 adenylate cyclase/HAMP domain-containing protein